MSSTGNKEIIGRIQIYNEYAQTNLDVKTWNKAMTIFTTNCHNLDPVTDKDKTIS